LYEPSCVTANLLGFFSQHLHLYVPLSLTERPAGLGIASRCLDYSRCSALPNGSTGCATRTLHSSDGTNKSITILTGARFDDSRKFSRNCPNLTRCAFYNIRLTITILPDVSAPRLESLTIDNVDGTQKVLNSLACPFLLGELIWNPGSRFPILIERSVEVKAEGSWMSNLRVYLGNGDDCHTLCNGSHSLAMAFTNHSHLSAFVDAFSPKA